MSPLLLSSAGPPPTSLPSPGSNLELFLLERAKALQGSHNTPPFPSFPGPQPGFHIRSGLFPAQLPGQM